MERIFTIFTNTIMACLAISTLLHMLLYASDSTEYKLWVTLQITIQIIAIFILLLVKKYSIKALIEFSLLSVLFTLINAIYINYGNIELHTALFILFWVVYSSLAYQIRGKFNAHANIA